MSSAQGISAEPPLCLLMPSPLGSPGTPWGPAVEETSPISGPSVNPACGGPLPCKVTFTSPGDQGPGLGATVQRAMPQGKGGLTPALRRDVPRRRLAQGCPRHRCPGHCWTHSPPTFLKAARHREEEGAAEGCRCLRAGKEPQSIHDASVEKERLEPVRRQTGRRRACRAETPASASSQVQWQESKPCLNDC